MKESLETMKMVLGASISKCLKKLSRLFGIDNSYEYELFYFLTIF
jgi:hypothetical protein